MDAAREQPVVATGPALEVRALEVAATTLVLMSWARTSVGAVPMSPVEACVAVNVSDRSAVAAWHSDAAARHCEVPHDPGADSQMARCHRHPGLPRSPQTPC